MIICLKKEHNANNKRANCHFKILWLPYFLEVSIEKRQGKNLILFSRGRHGFQIRTDSYGSVVRNPYIFRFSGLFPDRIFTRIHKTDPARDFSNPESVVRSGRFSTRRPLLFRNFE
jgi:hypothetical protein